MDDRLEPTASPRPLLDLFPTPASDPPDLLRSFEADATTCEGFYGLSEQPFSLSTDPKFLYRSASHDKVGQELLTAIRRHEPIAVVTGEVGSGKTILCRAVIEELDTRTVAAFVGGPLASREELLTAMLAGFGVQARSGVEDSSRGELVVAVRDFLASLVPLQAFAVLFVDDAQNLSDDLFQQLHVLVETPDDRGRLQIVLIGQPSLLTRLRRPGLEPIARRITVRCALGRLAPEEIVGYVSHRLSVAGANPRVDFSDAAAARIYELSAGVPTVMNLLCDRALTLGHRALANDIDAGLVDAAAFDLDIAHAEPVGRWLLRDALIIAAFGVLVLIGALVAARIFHEPLSRLITRWGG